MTTQINKFEEQKLFLKTGYCKHDVKYEEVVNIPNTNVHIRNCGICGEEKERWYA